MMAEINVNEKTFLINPDKILYIRLGDGSLPSKKSEKVWIYFSDERFICFPMGSATKAKHLYERIKRALKPFSI